MELTITITCKYCGGIKETTVKNAVFCSASCKKSWWEIKRRKERAALELLRRAVETISDEGG